MTDIGLLWRGVSFFLTGKFSGDWFLGGDRFSGINGWKGLLFFIFEKLKAGLY